MGTLRYADVSGVKKPNGQGYIQVDAFEIHIPSDPKYAKIVRCCVDHVGQLCRFPEEICRQLTLAVDEAFTNVIRHAYQQHTDQPVTLRCAILSDRLEIVLHDRGTAADPASLKSRDLADIRPGGLGMHFIHSVMDIVDYQPSENGNQLTLAKYLPKGGKKHAEN